MEEADRRNAAAARSEYVWVNRDRFPAGKPVHGLRQVQLPSATDQQNRRLTTEQMEVAKDENVQALLTVDNPENPVAIVIYVSNGAFRQ